MAAPGIKASFALDSNILIDLGEHRIFAHDFLNAYKPRGLAVPPTVVQELAYIVESQHSACIHALEALKHLRDWGITPYDLKAVGHGITEVNARKLMESGIVPDGEFNDGVILIETALANIPALVTSDSHLLKINPAELARALTDFHLSPVVIHHPKDLLRAYRDSIRPRG